ncbi:MAG: hypothetical protein HGA45_33330 [Chloroflexales bacterium]|nr:hypothetical protein [Chloroflexales bacterium]
MIVPPLPTEFRTALARLYEGPPILRPPEDWLTVLRRLSVELGATTEVSERFAHAWERLYSATLLLDHVQDNDDLGDQWIATLPASLQYQLAFGAYADASHGLSELATLLPPERAVRLHGLWSTTVMQLATGQYRDLTVPTSAPGDIEQSLDSYEELAAQKTGAAFALALGGCACAATDNTAQVEAATTAGVIVGMLLQYKDDLYDREAQASQPQALTLASAWAIQFGERAEELPLTHIWAQIYAHYAQALAGVLLPLPAAAQAIIGELIHTMFGAPPSTSPMAPSSQSPRRA